jgi:hypothetical protein
MSIKIICKFDTPELSGGYSFNKIIRPSFFFSNCSEQQPQSIRRKGVCEVVAPGTTDAKVLSLFSSNLIVSTLLAFDLLTVLKKLLKKQRVDLFLKKPWSLKYFDSTTVRDLCFLFLKVSKVCTCTLKVTQKLYNCVQTTQEILILAFCKDDQKE